MRLIQPFTTALVLAAIGVVHLFIGGDVQSQEIPRDAYLRYLPLKYPAIVRQTEASAEMDLFGDTTDPAYQDTNPVDGIDDDRREVLLNLAVRFGPSLVLNSTMIPMDFRLFMAREEVFPLFIDTWDVSRDQPKLVRSAEIDWQTLSRPTSEAGFRGPGTDIPDNRLLSLLEAFDPFAPGTAYRSGAVAPERTEHQVMFFNFPGDSEETWQQAYVNQISGALPQAYEDFAKVFVHPFVESVQSSVTGHRGYEFVLQYWFFYPYNDGFNNHEGDWEHINVFIKPLDKLHEPLGVTDIRRILTGGGTVDTAPDRLVIQRVDYYFHHKVMTLDYTRPSVYQSREAWEQELENTTVERLGEAWIWRQVRYRAYWDADETIINTHPIGFIGGDNKGTDQLLKHPGGSNRVSNGTYPFPGLYKNVGQAGAAEQISQRFDHREYFDFAAGDRERAVPEGGYRRGSVVNFASPDRIEILPDGERVVSLVKADAQARRDWAWLVLPIRWGYPATESPFAGTIAHTDLGNSSVLGPSYNAGWNRVGDAPGFQVYSPHPFGSLFPLTWQDSFANNLGYLNLTLPSLAVLPPFNISWRAVSKPFRSLLDTQDRIFQPNERVPYRFLSVEALGVSYMLMDSGFLSLLINPKQVDDIGDRLATALMRVEGVVGEDREFVENAYMLHNEINLYLGDRIASQSSLRYGRTTMGYDLALPTINEVFQIRGDLNFWEYSGSLRYNLTTGSLMTFVKGGYGLSWYRVENAATNGVLLPHPESPWFNKPTLKRPSTLLPNTWHFGGGIEWVPIQSIDPLPRGIDIGIRGDALIYRHALGIDIDTVVLTSSGIPISAGPADSPIITRYIFNLAATISF